MEFSVIPAVDERMDGNGTNRKPDEEIDAKVGIALRH